MIILVTKIDSQNSGSPFISPVTHRVVFELYDALLAYGQRYVPSCSYFTEPCKGAIHVQHLFESCRRRRYHSWILTSRTDDDIVELFRRDGLDSSAAHDWRLTRSRGRGRTKAVYCAKNKRGVISKQFTGHVLALYGDANE